MLQAQDGHNRVWEVAEAGSVALVAVAPTVRGTGSSKWQRQVPFQKLSEGGLVTIAPISDVAVVTAVAQTFQAVPVFRFFPLLSVA